MTLMNLILFFYFFMIQFKGVSSQTDVIDHYSRVGQDTRLSCDRAALQGPTCSRVKWFYNRDTSQFRLEVWNGKVEVNSPRSSRLRLNTDCSLTVHNVTDEDSGRYICRLSVENYWYSVYLSVLSVSPAPVNKTGQITLECTLQVHYTRFCPNASFHWLNENGAVLSGGGITQNNCVSSLTVERQSEHRTYTCQYVLNNRVQISADYTPEVRERGNPGSSDSNVSYVSVVAGAVLSLLVLHVVVVAGIFKMNKTTDGDQTSDAEVMSCVCFDIINHQNLTPKKKSEEEEKYSTEGTYVSAEEDEDVSVCQRNRAVHFHVI